MTRWTNLLIITAAGFAVTAAQPLPTLADLQPGLWEVTAAEHEKVLARQCIADVPALARFEHRGKACTSPLAIPTRLPSRSPLRPMRALCYPRT